MVSCYDCDLFGIGCCGIVPPMGYKDSVDEFCSRYLVVPWRGELYKPSGEARL
jgi:hypothetical protein